MFRNMVSRSPPCCTRLDFVARASRHATTLLDRAGRRTRRRSSARGGPQGLAALPPGDRVIRFFC